MGSTFVTFRDRSFEASDAVLEIWLHLLVEAIDKTPHLPNWLKEVREEWYIQATEVFGFGVMPGLDRIVTSLERRDVILGLCSTAMKRLHDYGPIISKDELNIILGADERHCFVANGRTERFEKAGEYLMKLLREELRPEESDARF